MLLNMVHSRDASKAMLEDRCLVELFKFDLQGLGKPQGKQSYGDSTFRPARTVHHLLRTAVSLFGSSIVTPPSVNLIGSEISLGDR